MFCKHKWDKLSEVVLPSAFEQMSKRGILEFSGLLPSRYYRKVVVIVLTCKHCGRLKKFRESNEL